MFLSELKLFNFRKYGTKTKDDGSEAAGLHVRFNEGLNLIVGENDSGKTAIIDAIKLLFLTQSREYVRVEYEDFHLPPGGTNVDHRTDSSRIEGIIRGFDNNNTEAKNFLEWLGIEKDEQGNDRYFLRVFLQADRKKMRTFYDLKAGPDDEGFSLDASARDLLRAIYLKPLRNAERELSPSRGSRLAQILDSHPKFQSAGQDHRLVDITKKANRSIENYFSGIEDDGSQLADQAGKEVLEEINTNLKEFFTEGESNKGAAITLSDPELKSILEKLLLDLAEPGVGLGSYNRLYIAAELLLLKRENYSGLKLALIEEIEAHLHPQAQLRLIEYLQKEISEASGVQQILTTHSPNLASKVQIKNLIMCRNSNAFSMDYSSTKLDEGDYLFLQRFLDVTKANLFFAQGVILVEGDAENLLIPTIADIIGKPLPKYGVSIVAVGGTAFLRYSKIFQRQDEKEGLMGIPVAIVTDNDIKPGSTMTVEQLAEHRTKKAERYDGQGVRTFISPSWTLEYDLCLSGLRNVFYEAVLQAEKIQNSNRIGLTDKKIQEVKNTIQTETAGWADKGDEEIAQSIYVDKVQEKEISKAIIAQCFSNLLREDKTGKLIDILKADPKIEYLVNAITYACGDEESNRADDT